MKSELHSKVVRLTEWVMSKRWIVLILCLLVAIGAGKGGGNLGFDNSYRVFFGENNPQLQAFDAIERIYTRNDNVVLAIAPKNKQVFTRDTLQIVEKVTDAFWQTPYSTRVDSLSNFQHTRAFGDDLLVENLVDGAETLTNKQLAYIQSVSLKEPLLKNRLISLDSKVTAVNITTHLPDDNPDAAVEVARFVRGYVKELRKAHPDHDFYLTGVVMLNSAFAEASIRDLSTLTPLMYVVIILLMFLFLRSFTATLGAVIVVFLSVMTAMGIAGWLGIKLAGPSSLAPTVILTLAVADSVHVLITLLQEMRKGASKVEAMKESMRINFRAVFITSLTTVIGFLSLNFSDTPPIRDLGNITSIGVTAAFLYSVFFLPVFVSIFPVRVKTIEAAKTKNQELLLSMANWVIAKRKPLFWGIAAIAIILTSLIPHIRLNDRFVEYFDKREEFRRHTDFVIKNLTGMYQVDYSLDAGEPSGVSNPEYLKKVDAFSEWALAQPKVIHVNTFTDMMKRVNRSMHSDDPSWYVLPDQKDLAAQYLLLYELSLPYGLDLTNQVNIEKSSTRLTVTLRKVNSDEIIAFAKRGDEWLRSNAPELIQYEGTGPSVMFSNISRRNIRSMITGTTIALLLIMVVLMIAFRSFGFGLLSLLPNMMPILMAFGVWYLLVGWAGFGISVVASVTLGIVVDDTVHFLSKYLRARREEGLGPEDAVRYAFSTVGVALFVTTIVLVIGFSILIFSSFLFNKHLGMLAVVTITMALLVDFLFLPPLLLMLDKEKEKVS